MDGFVSEQKEPLERFQRPRYTYSIQVVSDAPADSVVKVLARVTAWYAGPAPGKAGYRRLASSGRLESDLLEQLEDSLSAKNRQNVGQKAAPGANSGADTVKPPPPAPRPTVASNGIFKTPRAGATLPSRTEAATAEARASTGYEKSLREQEASLEEILRNQTHPTDLAAVKRAKTPVYARPSEQGDVLFLADAQDEYQVLNTSPEWVHVQISGLSRGWIRGPDVELPQKPGTPDSSAAAGGSAAELTAKPFRLVRQEVTAFPGDWAKLRGKRVRVLTMQPTGAAAVPGDAKWLTAKEMLHRAADRLTGADAANPVAGVVVIFDAADGGLVSATLDALVAWNLGKMSDDEFRALCSLDPAEAF